MVDKDRFKLLELSEDPHQTLRNWLGQAERSGQSEPTAMAIASVDERGQPSVRMVLIKEVRDDELVFYTNMNSRKARQILANPHVALVFHWLLPEHRQIRVEGVARRMSREESEPYFQSRPRGSQVGAWTSPQSEEIADRSVLQKRYDEIEERFRGQEVLPCPDFWGGFAIRTERMEFWIGRENRFHDRILFNRTEKGWRITELAP